MDIFLLGNFVYLIIPEFIRRGFISRYFMACFPKIYIGRREVVRRGA